MMHESNISPPLRKGQDKWYFFCFEILNASTESHLLRLLFAPIYLVYALKIPADRRLAQQLAWLEQYQEYVRCLKWDDALDELDTPADRLLLDRVRFLGKQLSSFARERTGVDIDAYFSKNRNVSDFPERFIAAILPLKGAGVRNELQDYYCMLIRKLFEGKNQLGEEALSRLRHLNQTIAWFHVTEPASGIKDLFFAQFDAIAYLLCAFSILGAAHAMELAPKPASRTQTPPNALARAQQLLEVDVSDMENPGQSMVSISLDHFIGLCTMAVDSRDQALLAYLEDVCKTAVIPKALTIQEKTAVRTLVGKLAQRKRDLSLELTAASGQAFNDVVRAMHTIINLEEAWSPLISSNR